MSPATPYRLSFSAVTLVPFALLIAAAAKADLAGTSRLAGPGWVRLGEWSFALFMTHQLVIRVFHAMVPSRAVGELLTLPLVGLCVVVAALAFRFVERPLERWLRGAQGPAVTVTTASRREGAVRPKG
jgi:peptidoglycan/LPS O-acetylase OafA/YrhL